MTEAGNLKSSEIYTTGFQGRVSDRSQSKTYRFDMSILKLSCVGQVTGIFVNRFFHYPTDRLMPGIGLVLISIRYAWDEHS